MCDLQELADAFDRLIKPVPMSALEISERLRSENYKAVDSDEVPVSQREGWISVADIGGNRVLMHRSER